jgi:type II secretory pathway pseudopilin PulG
MKCNCNKTKKLRGFTLVEVAVGMAGLVFVVVACMSTITISRVSALKAKEQAIALDFLVHYLETVRGLSFDSVRPGAAINPLLNGANGSPDIRIPADSTPISVETADFRAFHPELVWLAGRDAQLTATFSETPGGAPRFKHLEVRLQWDPPLGRGQRSSVWLDMVSVRDL